MIAPTSVVGNWRREPALTLRGAAPTSAAAGDTTRIPVAALDPAGFWGASGT